METQAQNTLNLKQKRIAILGYGNQGRAQALNLRDSGFDVVVGVRKGPSFTRAERDEFTPLSFSKALEGADVVMFLLPDQVIPKVYQDLVADLAKKPRPVGLAHGFVYHYQWIDKVPGCNYFLVGPRAAGTVLRNSYLKKETLPGVYAVEPYAKDEFKSLALQYAKAIGLKPPVATSFAEETVCDLFGEQTVLCGGILELMEAAYSTLVESGKQKEMAFFETCFEVKTIMELLLQVGPKEMANRISPTAFYGGTTRGKRVLPADLKERLKTILNEIESGQFASEWQAEVDANLPTLEKQREKLEHSNLQKGFETVRPLLAQQSHGKSTAEQSIPLNH